ncbi:unnamed protein product, partial [Adineta ricciae]
MVMAGSCWFPIKPLKWMKGFGSRNTASMKSPEGPGTSQFRAGFFDLGWSVSVAKTSVLLITTFDGVDPR